GWGKVSWRASSTPVTVRSLEQRKKLLANNAGDTQGHFSHSGQHKRCLEKAEKAMPRRPPNIGVPHAMDHDGSGIPVFLRDQRIVRGKDTPSCATAGLITRHHKRSVGKKMSTNA
ncbi:MAG: hypothetical protein OWU33_04665, partial [Firmicutes bacterium]|nr:hypothetical protein [Bacillota bacterium]